MESKTKEGKGYITRRARKGMKEKEGEKDTCEYIEVGGVIYSIGNAISQRVDSLFASVVASLYSASLTSIGRYFLRFETNSYYNSPST